VALLKVLGSTPRGSEFQAEVKKIPCLSHAKTYARTGLSHGQRAPMYGWGQGFGNFLDLCKKVFFLIQYRGGGLTLRRWSFFLDNSSR
jgi:hypothetical protein